MFGLLVKVARDNAPALAASVALAASAIPYGVTKMPDPSAQGQRCFLRGITPSTTEFENAAKAYAFLNP